MKPVRLSQLINELEKIRKKHADIEVWVQWHDPELSKKMCYGERITMVRAEPIPPGEPVCVIHANPA